VPTPEPPKPGEPVPESEPEPEPESEPEPLPEPPEEWKQDLDRMRWAARLFQNAVRSKIARRRMKAWRLRVDQQAARRIQGAFKGTLTRRLVKKVLYEIWRDMMKRMRLACTLLQDGVKGKIARRKLAWMRWRADMEAASVIQGAVRGFLIRRKFFIQDLAAMVIQGLIRGCEVRWRVRLERRKKENRAAARIQAMLRGHVARQLVSEMRERKEKQAAEILQGLVRGHIARQMVNEMREEKELAAAQRLQGLVRGCVARRKVKEVRKKKENDSASDKQGLVRGFLERPVVREIRRKKEKESASIIQGLIRGCVARRLVCDIRRKKEKMSASIIEGIVRGCVARRRMKAVDHAAQRLQGLVRGCVARRLVKQMREEKELAAAQRLQGLVRGCVARRKVKKTREEKELAASQRLQGLGRGFWVRKNWVMEVIHEIAEMQEQAVVIQAVVVARKVRKEFPPPEPSPPSTPETPRPDEGMPVHPLDPLPPTPTPPPTPPSPPDTFSKYDFLNEIRESLLEEEGEATTPVTPREDTPEKAPTPPPDPDGAWDFHKMIVSMQPKEKDEEEQQEDRDTWEDWHATCEAECTEAEAWEFHLASLDIAKEEHWHHLCATAELDSIESQVAAEQAEAEVKLLELIEQAEKEQEESKLLREMGEAASRHEEKVIMEEETKRKRELLETLKTERGDIKEELRSLSPIDIESPSDTIYMQYRGVIEAAALWDKNDLYEVFGLKQDGGGVISRDLFDCAYQDPERRRVIWNHLIVQDAFYPDLVTRRSSSQDRGRSGKTRSPNHIKKGEDDTQIDDLNEIQNLLSSVHSGNLGITPPRPSRHRDSRFQDRSQSSSRPDCTSQSPPRIRETRTTPPTSAKTETSTGGVKGSQVRLQNDDDNLEAIIGDIKTASLKDPRLRAKLAAIRFDEDSVDDSEFYTPQKEPLLTSTISYDALSPEKDFSNGTEEDPLGVWGTPAQTPQPEPTPTRSMTNRPSPPGMRDSPPRRKESVTDFNTLSRGDRKKAEVLSPIHTRNLSRHLSRSPYRGPLGEDGYCGLQKRGYARTRANSPPLSKSAESKKQEEEGYDEEEEEDDEPKNVWSVSPTCPNEEDPSEWTYLQDFVSEGSMKTKAAIKKDGRNYFDLNAEAPRRGDLRLEKQAVVFLPVTSPVSHGELSHEEQQVLTIREMMKKKRKTSPPGSRNKVEETSDAFDTLDRNKDGVIDRTEWSAGQERGIQLGLGIKKVDDTSPYKRERVARELEILNSIGPTGGFITNEEEEEGRKRLEDIRFPKRVGDQDQDQDQDLEGEDPYNRDDLTVVQDLNRDIATAQLLLNEKQYQQAEEYGLKKERITRKGGSAAPRWVKQDESDHVTKLSTATSHLPQGNVTHEILSDLNRDIETAENTLQEREMHDQQQHEQAMSRLLKMKNLDFNTQSYSLGALRGAPRSERFTIKELQQEIDLASEEFIQDAVQELNSQNRKNKDESFQAQAYRERSGKPLDIVRLKGGGPFVVQPSSPVNKTKRTRTTLSPPRFAPPSAPAVARPFRVEDLPIPPKPVPIKCLLPEV